MVHDFVVGHFILKEQEVQVTTGDQTVIFVSWGDSADPHPTRCFVFNINDIAEP